MKNYSKNILLSTIRCSSLNFSINYSSISKNRIKLPLYTSVFTSNQYVQSSYLVLIQIITMKASVKDINRGITKNKSIQNLDKNHRNCSKGINTRPASSSLINN